MVFLSSTLGVNDGGRKLRDIFRALLLLPPSLAPPPPAAAGGNGRKNIMGDGRRRRKGGQGEEERFVKGWHLLVSRSLPLLGLFLEGRKGGTKLFWVAPGAISVGRWQTSNL